MTATGTKSEFVATVVIIHMCGLSHIERCLQTLIGQKDAPSFEVVIAHDGTLEGFILPPFPFPVRQVCHPPLQTVIDLAALGIKNARGEIVLLTEDHCVPSHNWVRKLCEEFVEGRSAVGGSIDTDPDSRGTTWAFYFSDFFPYSPPISEGPVPTLSVCNAAYRRKDLEHIRATWENGFHEPTVNSALRANFGPLWLVQGAGIKVRRDVYLRHAIVERFTQGRLFAADRVKGGSKLRSLMYAGMSPALPLVFLARMARKALSSPVTTRKFFSAFPGLFFLVLAWCVGETCGYLTRCPPRRVIYAPQVTR